MPIIRLLPMKAIRSRSKSTARKRYKESEEYGIQQT